MSEPYFPVNLQSLRVGSIPSFDLYLKHSGQSRPVLYREQNIPFSESVRDTLLDTGVERLWISLDQRDEYFDYVTRMVGDVVRDPSLPAPEIGRIVFDTAAAVMEDLFSSPRSSTRIRQAKKIINRAVDFMTQDPGATRTMLYLTHHDYYTYTHSVNVAIFGTALVSRLAGRIPDCHPPQLIAEGFLLHDIGKSAIPAAVLNKPGKLNDEEWRLMRQHPQVGYEILESAGEVTPPIEAIVLQHHERPDGMGYPRKLPESEIHPYARICCIADVFDAITTVRTYRQSLSTFDALATMRDRMGRHFDWEFFDEFVKLFKMN